MEDYSVDSFTSPLVPVSAAAFVPSKIGNAISAWRSLLGPANVETDRAAIESHGKNAYGSEKRGSLILRPQNESEVQQLVKIAAKYKTPIYPISTGRNWGYGAATPVVDGCAIVELSALNKIRIVDEELGVVALQPGVTQGMLYDFLVEKKLDFMVPVHGGGPSCSIIGNALERGYGLTPTTDHFAALTSLRAVLADGSIYVSPFHAMGAELIGSCHRWGIGPYVEGLFSQGSFGVVTEATFTLQRRPEHVEAFFLRIADDQQLGEIVDRLRQILSSMGGVIAGVNLMNDRRVLSMSRPYPVDKVAAGEVISADLCQKMANEAGISAWTAAGVIHCPVGMRRVIRRELNRLIPNSVSRPIYMNRRRVKYARSVINRLPISQGSFLKQLSSIESLLDLADGIPRRVALPLAYWLNGETVSTDRDLNPAQDGCGLIWYSPLVPMKSHEVRCYVRTVNEICIAHGIEPLITLTSLSERLFDSTVPILYRPNQPGALARAEACYQSLFNHGKKLGCLPYRLGASSMKLFSLAGDNPPSSLLTNLKRAVDSNGIISPGRYCGN